MNVQSFIILLYIGITFAFFYFGGNIPVFKDWLITRDKGGEISEFIIFCKTVYVYAYYSELL